MAVLSDIREKSPKFIITGAVIVFIFLIVFDWGLDISDRRGRTGHHEVLGKVDGKEITYKQFTEYVQRAIENQKQQKADIDEETERQIRAQVWNQMVDEILIQNEIERLGITVSDQEIRDIVNSPNPPEFLVQQFRDSAGVFRRDAYQQAMVDPQNRDAWIQVEEIIRQQQKQLKLQSLLLASVNISEGELRQRFIDRNIILNADYVLFDINRLIPDSAVTITDEDLKKQYEEHPTEFQTKATRKIKYVTFLQNPSAEDSASILEEAQQLLDQAKSGAVDFIELAKTYSEIPISDTFFKRGELSQKKENAVFAAKKGDIVGPIVDFDGVHIIKILDQRQGTNEYVKASHILINLVQGPDSVKAIQKAKELLAKARAGADFAKLASENSQDYGSARQGGDLGWNTRERWVKPFADAAFKARVGEIVGPVRTQFGWHIIKVEGKDKREIKIANLALKIKASPKTIEAVYQRAQEFSYFAKEEGFEKAAENSQLLVRETPEFQKTGVIPGVGMNEAINNFAFNNKLGSISDPLSIRNGLIVAKVSSIRDEGLRPLEEVKNIVRSMALKQKKMDKIREQVNTFYKTLTPETNLILAAQSNPNLIAQNTGPFKPSESPRGVGRELNFIGTAISLKPGELSKPIEGTRGLYIIKLLSKSEFDSTSYSLQREALRSQVLQEKRQRIISDWQIALREKAEIIDHRDKFFR